MMTLRRDDLTIQDEDDTSLVHSRTVTRSLANETSAVQGVSACPSSLHECNIGKLLADGINLHDISRERKYQVLKHKPYICLSVSTHMLLQSGSFRQFQPTWLNKHPWIHYSHHDNGVYCHAGVFFAGEQLSGQSPGQFISLPFKNWVVQSQKMNAHSRSTYHMMNK